MSQFITCLCDYEAEYQNVLSFKKGQTFELVNTNDPIWWEVVNPETKTTVKLGECGKENYNCQHTQ